MPFSYDRAQGGRETLLAQARLVGELADDLIVHWFEVDNTGNEVGF